ncbi:unnamed protein product [Gongylonema pulchrum]|uniref:Vitellogenin domain-containing protein n=1 Tax=Gongylonema pulchrum TaxID=637853 RepID=A0A183DKX2_9BILA|nr:unnamed protein product [Gongylonema pulchrum]
MFHPLVILLLSSNLYLVQSEQSFYKHNEFEEGYFQTEREYHYSYDGQYSTGLPEQSAHFGSTRFHANLTLQFISHASALLKLNNIRFGLANGILADHRELHAQEQFETKEFDDEYNEIFKLPVRFDYIDGLVSKVSFDSKDRPWFKNFKRGVLNILQINMKKKHRIEEEKKLRLEEGYECDPCKRRLYEYKDFFTSQEVIATLFKFTISCPLSCENTHSSK